MPQDLHSCSWFCEQPLCVRAQRDELRQRVEELETNGPQMQRGHNGDGSVWMGSMRECLADARSCADAEASIADALVTENKVLRARIAELDAAKERLCIWLLGDATCPCCEAEDVCADDCTFADDAPDDAERMEEIRAVLRAAIGTPRPQPESAVSGPALTRS